MTDYPPEVMAWPAPPLCRRCGGKKWVSVVVSEPGASCTMYESVGCPECMAIDGYCWDVAARRFLPAIRTETWPSNPVITVDGRPLRCTRHNRPEDCWRFLSVIADRSGIIPRRWG